VGALRRALGHVRFDDPRHGALARIVVPRLDTRPEHRASLAEIAYTVLHDMPLRERALLSAERASAESLPEVDLVLRQLRMDVATYKVRMFDATLQANDRSEAFVRYARKEPISEADEKRFLKEFQTLDAPWDGTRTLIDYYDSLDSYAKERTLAKDYLARHDDGSLIAAAAWAVIARSHAYEGHPELGLQAIRSAAATGNFEGQQWKALLLARKGNGREALAVARDAYAQYGGVSGLAVVASVHWLGHDYPQAAKVLHEKVEKPHTPAEWGRATAYAFLITFRDSSDKERHAALDALAAEFPGAHDLQTVVEGFGERPEAAYLVDKLLSRDPNNPTLLMSRYCLALHLDGPEKTGPWLEKIHVGRDELLDLYKRDIMDPLWQMADPTDPELLRTMWLLRVSGAMQSGKISPEQRERASKWFAAHTDGAPPYGLYLLGTVDEKTLAASARSLDDTADCAFFMGVRAQFEARHVDASDLFRVAVETGRNKVFGHQVAINELLRYHDAGTLLSSLGPGHAPRIAAR
jgi:hypothetical protein